MTCGHGLWGHMRSHVGIAIPLPQCPLVATALLLSPKPHIYSLAWQILLIIWCGFCPLVQSWCQKSYLNQIDHEWINQWIDWYVIHELAKRYGVGLKIWEYGPLGLVLNPPRFWFILIQISIKNNKCRFFLVLINTILLFPNRINSESH